MTSSNGSNLQSTNISINATSRKETTLQNDQLKHPEHTGSFPLEEPRVIKVDDTKNNTRSRNGFNKNFGKYLTTASKITNPHPSRHIGSTIY